MSPWPYWGRSCPSTRVIHSTPVHIWFFDWFLGASGGRRFCGGDRDNHKGLLRCSPGTSSCSPGNVKVGQRVGLYSERVLEHISTSLLTGEAHCGGSRRRGEEGEMTASSQLSLAVTVPLITGFQTECGEAGHLPS